MDKNLLSVGNPVYQTLSDFLIHPFGVPFTDVGENLNPKYDRFKTMISVSGYSILDESYYIHVKVPSESQPGKTYDVVIQFMPKTDTMTKEHTLDSYVIQFFSNSPSFIYKYAALYKLHGYMIDALQEKLDPEYANKLPEKSNTKMMLMYDKSIYFATKYLYDNRLTFLSKSNLRYFKKISFKELIDSITDNKISLNTSAYDIEKQVIKEGRVDREKIKKEVGKLVKRSRGMDDTGITKKTPITSTLSNTHTSISKRTKISGKNKKSKIRPSTSIRSK